MGGMCRYEMLFKSCIIRKRYIDKIRAIRIPPKEKRYDVHLADRLVVDHSVLEYNELLYTITGDHS